MRVVVWDIETSNLRSDIGSLLIASFGVLNEQDELRGVETRDMLQMHQTGRRNGEERLAQWVVEQVEAADILIGHHSTTFDEHFVNGVLARLARPPLPKRVHIDTLQIARAGMFGYQSISLENLAGVFKLEEQKDKPVKEVWREANLLDPKALARLRKRCEADVRVTAALWRKLKPTYMQWKGR